MGTEGAGRAGKDKSRLKRGAVFEVNDSPKGIFDRGGGEEQIQVRRKLEYKTNIAINFIRARSSDEGRRVFRGIDTA